jgi:hypothetical protein
MMQACELQLKEERRAVLRLCYSCVCSNPWIQPTHCCDTPLPLPLAVALCAARLASSPDFKAGVEDRAYRLHYNQGQNRVDLFSKVGTAVGGTAALLFLPASAAAVVSAGAAGAAFGVLAHIASAPKSQS